MWGHKIQEKNIAAHCCWEVKHDDFYKGDHWIRYTGVIVDNNSSFNEIKGAKTKVELIWRINGKPWAKIVD